MSQDVLSIIASFFGSFGFAIIYNIRGRRVLIPAIGGAVFWAVYLVFLHFVNNEYLGFFVVAILITIYSEIWARILKTPATTVLMLTVDRIHIGNTDLHKFSFCIIVRPASLSIGAHGHLLHWNSFFFRFLDSICNSVELAATSEIDKATSKGVYHKNTASRKVSRLAKAVSAMA